MNNRRNDKHRDTRDTELEALYRKAADIEPDGGLDRIVRARADEAVGSARSSRLRPWLGGLITASVAIVAIAVVLQQSPPADRGPASPSAPAEETGALMAPSVGADTGLESSPDSQRARREIRRMYPPAGSAEAESPPTDSAQSNRAQPMARQQRATESDDTESNDIVGDQSGIVTDKARAVSEEIAADADAALARLEAMIEDGEIQHAREFAEEFRQKYPRYPIPERIEEALEPLD